MNIPKEKKRMITSYKDLKYYISEDKRALGIKKHFPSFWGDDIWKMEILLRVLEYICNVRGDNVFLKILYRILSYHYKKRCEKRCCEIPINSIGPGLCIWHGFNIIINPKVKM